MYEINLFFKAQDYAVFFLKTIYNSFFQAFNSRKFLSVLNFKYVVFSFSFIYLPMVSDYLISILTSVECLQRKDCPFFG